MSTNDNAIKISWYKVPVPRKTLQSLHQRSDGKGFLQAGGFLGLLALTGTAAWLTQDRLYLFLPILFLHGTFWTFLGPGRHELVHNSVFQSKLLNAIFLRLYCFLSWDSHVMYWASHFRHHKYTLHPPDDLEVELPYDLSLKSFLKTGFVDVGMFYKTLKGAIRLSLGKDEGTIPKQRSTNPNKAYPLESEWHMRLFPRENVEERHRLFNWARVLLIGHTSIVAVAIYFGLWALPLIVSFAGFYGGWLKYLCVVPQHAGLQDAVPDFRLCCRTIILNPFLRFLYFQMNYHTEHHMYPAVPCYNLAKLHRLIKHQMPDCPRGLWATWRQLLSIRKKQLAEPGYQYVPELPTDDATTAGEHAEREPVLLSAE